MNRSILRTALLASAGFVTAAPPLEAQIVTGRVVEAGTDRPLSDVSVRLRLPAGQLVARAVSDSLGEFALSASRLGSFELSAERIGMETVVVPAVEVRLGTVEIILRMAETAVPLEPITVQARGIGDLGPLRGYYERMERNERTGTGRFITRDQIERRNPPNVSDMLRELPRVTVRQERGRGAHVTVRGGGSECIPAVFMDGMRTNRRERAYIDELVRPGDLEGVEVYAGLAQMPGIYHDESGCGVLLFWTRRGDNEPHGRPMTWRRVAMGLGMLGLLLLVAR
jgi:hypothetical protein